MIKKSFLILLIFIVSLSAQKPEKPGSHKKNQCDSGSKYTFDVYIPKAYAEKSDKQFPVLYLSSPSGNPGFRKLEKWAEENEFLLITINESKNKISWDEIFKIQDDVMRSTSYLRKHHALQFATGFSGSAWASVHLANRYPKNIAGVFMNCHSGNGTVLQDKSKSIALVAGKTDKIHAPSYVEGVYKMYKSKGFHTQYENLSMGHSWAPLDKFTENLNFMYNYQKFANKYLTKEELQAAYSALEKEELVKISEMSNKKSAMSKLKSFMAVPKLIKSQLGIKIYTEWGKAALAYANDNKESDPAHTYFFITDEANAQIIKKLPSGIRNSLNMEARNLSRKKAVVDEINADKKFQYYQRQVDRVRNKKAADKLIPKIEKFMEEFSGTRAAEKAKAAIATLKGKK